MISSCSAWMVATMSSISPVRARSSSASSASPPRRRVAAVSLAAATEQVVRHGDDRAAVHHDLAAAGQPERVLGARPVEGHRHRRPPVHDDGIGPSVLDVAPADVPGRPFLLVDTAEEQRPWAVRQQRHPAREGGDVVQIGIPGGDEIVQQPLCPLPHGREGLQGLLQVCLFGRELLVDGGSAHPRRDRRSAQNAPKHGRAKIPGHPGDFTAFLSALQASQLGFPLLIRPDFEPLTKGPYRLSLYSKQPYESSPLFDRSQRSAGLTALGAAAATASLVRGPNRAVPPSSRMTSSAEHPREPPARDGPRDQHAARVVGDGAGPAPGRSGATGSRAIRLLGT